MKNIYIVIGALLALTAFSGCSEDFLERPPKDQLVDANFYRTNDQVLAGTALLYNQVWFDYNDKASFTIGDFRGGTVYDQWGDRDIIEFNTTPSAPRVAEAYRSFFNAIGQSNTVIQNVNRYAKEGVSDNIKAHAIAEARFMRATAYTHLVMNFGAVPIIENNQTLLSDTTIARNTVESVWEFITRDYLAAMENLPETPVQPGRITRYSAEGMLARTYLTRAGVEHAGGARKQEFLDKAKMHADNVILKSGRALLPNYYDLFKFPYDNNAESLFELQWVYHPTAYGTQNSVPAYIQFSPDIANGEGWGGAKGATYWMLEQYEGLMTNGFTTDQRLKATFMMPGASYPEITQTAKDATGKSIEQKLIVPSPSATADISLANVKKYVPGKAVDLNGEAAQQRYGINTYMLRLAEMYLIYAEASLGNSASTSEEKTLRYFNAVRLRAGLPAHPGPITWEDIFKERIVEFAMEGMSWYDMVRLHYYNPQKAYDIIGAQDRGHYVVKPNQTPNPTRWTFAKTSWSTARNFKPNSGNFLLPFPAAELSQAPNLHKAPVPYKF
ncbi:MAG: RagB/SusD family nutrient uptake outer membrane protein [Adhaeribacter sp.]